MRLAYNEPLALLRTEDSQMIVGRPDRFAIQFEVEDRSEWLFGRFAYVLNHRLVGRYDKEATLAVAVSGITVLLTRAGQRVDPELLAMPTSHAFKTLHTALYVDDARTDAEVHADAERFSQFCVSGIIDVLDDWHCFPIEGNGIGRFLYARWDEIDNPLEVVLREGEFDEVCQQFLKSVG